MINKGSLACFINSISTVIVTVIVVVIVIIIVVVVSAIAIVIVVVVVIVLIRIEKQTILIISMGKQSGGDGSCFRSHGIILVSLSLNGSSVVRQFSNNEMVE